MATDDDRQRVPAPEVEQPDQPERDDLIEPEEIDPTREEAPAGDIDAGQLPPQDERPESQGFDVLDAGHRTEEASPRRLLSDEEAETSIPPADDDAEAVLDDGTWRTGVDEFDRVDEVDEVRAADEAEVDARAADEEGLDLEEDELDDDEEGFQEADAIDDPGEFDPDDVEDARGVQDAALWPGTEPP